ncbi:BolA family transcriptional regulator [Leptolyngbya sp. 15MV]|nr:BolA family transcriptional regulator [Leptolyngbya sp. 15MV]
MSAAEIECMIVAALPGAVVEMTDLAGDNDHWAARVVAPQFAGISRVQQHKLVYDALGGRMGGVLHALQLTTAAPT